jgi:hypothetical protein
MFIDLKTEHLLHEAISRHVARYGHAPDELHVDADCTHGRWLYRQCLAGGCDLDCGHCLHAMEFGGPALRLLLRSRRARQAGWRPPLAPAEVVEFINGAFAVCE